MLAPGEAGDEERDGAVADELVDDAVQRIDDVCGQAVEARHQARELLGRHVLSERRRAADVGEKHRDLHLGSPRMLLDGADAPLAETPIERRWPVRNGAHEKTAWPAERRVAELASRRRRQGAPHAPHAVQARVVASQHPFPHLGRRRLRHVLRRRYRRSTTPVIDDDPTPREIECVCGAVFQMPTEAARHESYVIDVGSRTGRTEGVFLAVLSVDRATM